MKQIDRDALREWEEFKADIDNSTPTDPSMSQADIEKHRIYLEAHPIEWIKFFFPKAASCEFAAFQVKTIMRLLANAEWYEVLSWARELAKSTIVMFVVMYLVLTGRKKNVVITSNSLSNAVRLLAPYRANLESNNRIKAYYGEQQSVGFWTEDEFITKDGAAFRALGAGQSPRGSRNEEIRPDVLIPDDFDTDEDCMNPDTINKKWDWWEKALYPTRSTSEPTLVIFCGNIIAKDCCITRAGKMADSWDIVNIRDDHGKSSWSEKNSEAAIDRTLSKISAKAVQAEYYNNPMSEGEIFKDITYGKVPPLNKFRFLVAYGDPAPGENKTKKSSTKTIWLCGRIEQKLYIIKGFLDRGLNAEFIDWYAELIKYVGGKTTVYCYMENNSLQDPFFQQVFKPLVAQKRAEHRVDLNVLPDTEKKTDKATRIDANLEPMNREGNLIFNEAEKDNPHMKRLEDQFRLFTLRMSYPADGPDCIEGAKRVIDRKIEQFAPPIAVSQNFLSSRNKHRM